MHLEVMTKVYVDDKKFNVDAETLEAGTKSARQVHEELEKQMNTRSLKLSGDGEGNNAESKVLRTSRWMMKTMTVFCEKQGPGFIYSAENVGDYVRVIDWWKMENQSKNIKGSGAKN